MIYYIISGDSMSYYLKHLFFCINQRENGKKCCAEVNAEHFCHYAKAKIRSIPEIPVESVRVSRAGCLGRCVLGPSLVIYPEGVWYSYRTEQDIDEIVE